MSSKKVIRLKSPSRGNLSLTSPVEPGEGSGQMVEQTIMRGFRAECGSKVHGVLVDQLNKAYQEMNDMKARILDDEEVKQALLEETSILKGRLEMLERECGLEKEKYLLERQNHEQLRQFYEKREKQWMAMLCEQRRVLEYYDCRNQGERVVRTDNQTRRSADCKAETTRSRSIEQSLQQSHFPTSRDGLLRRNFSKASKIPRKSLSTGKGRSSQANHMFNFSHRIFEQQTKCVMVEPNASLKRLKSINEGSEHKPQYHDRESDELFDKIVRMTCTKLRQEGRSLQEMGRCEDMQKLKKARSSTKQRLFKTLKKLQIEAQGDKQLKAFIDHIENAVAVEQTGEFRGDLAYQFLMEKLKECEKLAQASNSLINIICEEPSEVSVSSGVKQKIKYIIQQSEAQKRGKSDAEVCPRTVKRKPGTLIDQLSQSNFEQLMLTSNVRVVTEGKQIWPEQEPQISQVKRADSSSLLDLSDIINASRDYRSEATRV